MTRPLLILCGLACYLLIRCNPARAEEPGAARVNPLPNVGSGWKCVMTLDQRRQLIAGDPKELRQRVPGECVQARDPAEVAALH